MFTFVAIPCGLREARKRKDIVKAFTILFLIQKIANFLQGQNNKQWMLALMLYTYLKGKGISNGIECGLLFYY